ncbi:response regulator transcription factor [Marinilactibacillus kalidii]|uniref:response regulator transcription factor n=1 Tax=Marinilactibacillus kalidii TaxID=2820274 RepID=UPI001ABE36D8|nr:response regulator transcription factor [Marinilactibacillus kalidii]
MAHIMIIDDDLDLLKLMRRALEKVGHTITVQLDSSTVNIQAINQCDLLLLDVMMPTVDGFTFLRSNRNQIDIPVLFLTAKSFEKDILEGFASGGDDYITKPFSIKELRARVEAHLRRETREKQYRLNDGTISADLIQRTFYCLEKPVNLTASEYDICLLLLKNKGQVFSKEAIYTSVYGFDGEGDSQTTITERIKKIRHKFSAYHEQPIQTVWGIGYKWLNDPSNRF